ncbi:MAG: cytochrome ubiquinol oxidase subunit I [Actinomycetales bacterium]|nr:cytochrome ubiquinol oxidase subunit I [Actinomycetales bacterium]
MSDSLVVDLARLQFATTTLFHFVFVPLTLGLGPIVAIFATLAYRTRLPAWERLSRMFGGILLINFAMGVVTGLVQEFQFGMNWSGFSAFVGGVFGAPLVMEGLLAFFLESTFLGLWAFGRDRLPRGLHLACLWLFVIGTWLSAFFILVANTWMQDPVAYELDASGSAQLTDVWALVLRPFVLAAWVHALLAGLITASIVVFGIAAWHLGRRQHVETMQRAWRTGLIIGITAGVLQGGIGDWLGVIVTDRQPMKLAAAEAIWQDTGPCAGFSVFAIPDMNERRNLVNVQIPCVLSLLATNSLDGSLQGMDSLQAAAEEAHGPGDYTPNVWIQYWAWRGMMGFGLLGVAWMALAAWRTRRGRLPDGRRFWRISTWIIPLPFIGSLLGWVVTENGRQPWVVTGLLKTQDAASHLSMGLLLTSLVTFVVMYSAFAVVEFRLIRRYAMAGPPRLDTAPRQEHDDHLVLL